MYLSREFKASPVDFEAKRIAAGSPAHRIPRFASASSLARCRQRATAWRHTFG